ncbi:S-adenosyl-L-methionine-dependent tRNA 4-demethylwyosine synthase TYW1-like isoform X2 [Actinia tenebrosa]|nr:S-adenosyl-L-methionine-dependent tRNA 4-demethylwyosine synthase TYW1-like isoform X2 [Actinia tenebrosa]
MIFKPVMGVVAGILGIWLWTTLKAKQDEEKLPKTRDPNQADKLTTSAIKIFYGTQTGTAKKFAEMLQELSTRQGTDCSVTSLKDYEPEDNLPNESCTCVFIVSTYTDGQPPEDAVWFCKWLEESSNDFRVQKSLLGGVKYAVFGLGNSLYKDNFNMVAKNIDQWMTALSAQPAVPLRLGDENHINSKHGGIEADFEAWTKELLATFKSTSSCECGSQETCCKDEKNPQPLLKDSDEDAMYESSTDEDNDDESDKNRKKDPKSSGMVDLEDLGPALRKMKKAKEMENGSLVNEPKEMVTTVIRESLTKQGYKIIGSHSGVKICRWTKAMLRGRGGCYKHTFYGIESHRCMETTPSLACANKCVFCWRHHTNPVGTEWKWQMNEPEMIVDGAMQNHFNMIKQFRGVPGVKLEKFEEAMKIKHCALSLVGEPIMYPKINELIKLLHGHEISTFLVTNAQFPDAIKNLVPVTQLYVSVDASTKESLKKIDRPLFRDFWPRFLDSLKALSDKGQRTVYRLTLVKSWNTDELKSYADLVALGKPDFIEVKGVTYCGESKASTLTMANVPWHQEVVGFVQQLVALLPDYELACEHEHSNCLLIAHKKFNIDGDWHTWIDYSKFHELIRDYEDSEGKASFSSLDYMAKTPNWAVFGDEHRGFDPDETRWYRKNRKDISGC